MRVLQVSNTFPPADISGVGTLVAELHAELLRGGHDAVAVVRRAQPGAGIVAVGGSKLLFPLAAARAYLRLSRADRQRALDVVHVHESDGVLVALLVRLLRRFGGRGSRPLLYATLQVSYARERRAVRSVRAMGRIVSRPVASEWIFKLVRAPLLSLLGRLTARLADGVVTPSEATRIEVREDYGVRTVAVIPNGIDAGQETGLESAAPRAGHAGTVLFVGRLRTRKAVAVLLEAWAPVARELPAARLVLLGDGEQRQRLAQQIERLGIGGSVRLAGAVPRDETARWLAEADVFCLPSTYEGFPLAILEAMAAGLPVVATAVAGIPEAVEDGRTGILVPPEDAAALSAALLRLLRDPELRARTGREGRQRLIEKFSIPTVTAAYLRLWRMSPAPPNQLPPAT